MTINIAPDALARVEAWSRRIHGTSERHQWCMDVARAILDGTSLPPAPRRWMPGVPKDRIETIRRIISGETR